ncbi:MAG: hypothetical protein ACYC2I_12535 [Elusimicrobiales bacterium]
MEKVVKAAAFRTAVQAIPVGNRNAMLLKEHFPYKVVLRFVWDTFPEPMSKSPGVLLFENFKGATLHHSYAKETLRE